MFSSSNRSQRFVIAQQSYQAKRESFNLTFISEIYYSEVISCNSSTEHLSSLNCKKPPRGFPQEAFSRNSPFHFVSNGLKPFMSRSQLEPWLPLSQQRAWDFAQTGSPEEIALGSHGFCAAPPELGQDQSGPNLAWTGTAPTPTYF